MPMLLGFTATGESTVGLELVSGYLKGAPRVEPALKTKAARKRVETGKIIVEPDGDLKMSFEWFVGCRPAK